MMRYKGQNYMVERLFEDGTAIPRMFERLKDAIDSAKALEERWGDVRFSYWSVPLRKWVVVESWRYVEEEAREAI
jgi:hypothetical protein